MTKYPVDHFLYRASGSAAVGAGKRISVSESRFCQRIWETIAWTERLHLGMTITRGKLPTQIIQDEEEFDYEISKAKHWSFLFDKRRNAYERIRSCQDIPNESQYSTYRSNGLLVIEEIRFALTLGQHHPELLTKVRDRMHPQEDIYETKSDVYADKIIETVALLLIFDELQGPWIAFKEALDCGLLPFAWQGTWPDGHLLVYCPPDALPAGLVSTAPKRAPRRRRPAAVELADADIPRRAATPTERKAWAGLVAEPTTLLAYWSPWVRTQAGQRALSALVQRVERIAEGEAGTLAIHLRDAAGDVVVLACQPGLATRGKMLLPASAAAVARRHNGIRMYAQDAAFQTLLSWRRSDGKRFAGEWEGVWYTTDNDDPAEPFPVPPLMPFADSDNLYVLHPTQQLPDGEPAVVIVQEGGGLSDPLSVPVGDAFLHRLAMMIGAVCAPNRPPNRGHALILPAHPP